VVGLSTGFRFDLATGTTKCELAGKVESRMRELSWHVAVVETADPSGAGTLRLDMFSKGTDRLTLSVTEKPTFVSLTVTTNAAAGEALSYSRSLSTECA
jgi:hypothetical protein